MDAPPVQLLVLANQIDQAFPGQGDALVFWFWARLVLLVVLIVIPFFLLCVRQLFHLEGVVLRVTMGMLMLCIVCSIVFLGQALERASRTGVTRQALLLEYARHYLATTTDLQLRLELETK